MKPLRKRVMSTTKATNVKSATVKELAGLYTVSPKTFRNWLLPHREKVGERRGHYYTARQIRIIFELLGEP
jgi:hypothetical protein